MSVIAELEEKALSLPRKARGQLADKLIASLGTPFDGEEGEDVLELALRRDREMDEHPDTVMSEEEFWASLEEFRRRYLLPPRTATFVEFLNITGVRPVPT